MSRPLPTRDQYGNFVCMADTGDAPNTDQLAAVLSQLLGAPVSADLLSNPRALSTIKEILCPPGSGGSQPGPQDQGGAMSDDRRADLLSKSQLGQAAAAKLSEDDADDTSTSPAPQSQQMSDNPSWNRGGRFRGSERQAHAQMSERSRGITRPAAQRAAQHLIKTAATVPGRPVQQARLDHLRKLSGIKPTK